MRNATRFVKALSGALAAAALVMAMLALQGCAADSSLEVTPSQGKDSLTAKAVDAEGLSASGEIVVADGQCLVVASQMDDGASMRISADDESGTNVVNDWVTGRELFAYEIVPGTYTVEFFGSDNANGFVTLDAASEESLLAANPDIELR